MAKPFSSNAGDLPFGLFLEKSEGVFWWTRNDQPSGKHLYAVCVQRLKDGVAVSAMRVIGYLDAKRTENRLRLNAMHWLIASENHRKVLRTVHATARDSIRQGTRDAHWFGVRADSPDEAKAHPDVAYVSAHIVHYQMTHAFRGIYFISNGNGAVKIGQTGLSLASRLAACQVGSPHELYVVAAIEDGDFKKTERRLHDQHKAHHIRGEWFSMDDSTAIAVAKSLGGREWVADSLGGSFKGGRS